eukprot:scaffold109719_cov47-Prasinocladus_malaysianus.AAC.2
MTSSRNGLPAPRPARQPAVSHQQRSQLAAHPKRQRLEKQLCWPDQSNSSAVQHSVARLERWRLVLPSSARFVPAFSTPFRANPSTIALSLRSGWLRCAGLRIGWDRMLWQGSIEI